MRQARPILLLNLLAPAQLLQTLRKILQSTSGEFPLRLEKPPSSEAAKFKAWLGELARAAEPSPVLIVTGSRHRGLVEPALESFRGQPLMIVADDSINPERIQDWLGKGAADFVTWPLSCRDLLPRLRRILRRVSRLDKLVKDLKTRLGLRELIGVSPPFVKEVRKIPLVAKCDTTVLIEGETGTGKELVARGIHYLSPRSKGPFVPLSCAGVPSELAENELFGHARGAFTGAFADQKGLVAESEQGTLFLDDVDCLSPSLQAKLLRFLQGKEYRRLGSAKLQHADVRVLSASNCDLLEAVRDGRFRQDLYHRLNVMPLRLPPLRDRPEDIPLLARHFLERFRTEFNGSAAEISNHAMRRLLLYPWPGNVRELKHAIERAVVMCEDSVVEDRHLMLPDGDGKSEPTLKAAKAKVVREFEKGYIEKQLTASRGNIARAARAAGKNRRAFFELIRKYKISVDRFKAPPRPER